MKLFYIFLLILLGIGVLIYFNGKNRVIREPFVDNNALHTYLIEAKKINKALKDLLTGNQSGGANSNIYNNNIIKNLSDQNDKLDRAVSTYNFEMAVAPIAPNPPAYVGGLNGPSPIYENDGYNYINQGFNTDNATDVSNLLNQITTLLGENRRILTNIQNRDAQSYNPDPTVAPVIPTPAVTFTPVTSDAAVCLNNGSYWDGLACLSYEDNCKNMDLRSYGTMWPQTQWDPVNKKCIYNMEFPDSSKTAMMRNSCQLLDGTWDDASNVCFNANISRVSRNLIALENNFQNICNTTPGYSFNARTNRCEPITQTPVTTTMPPVTTTFPPVTTTTMAPVTTTFPPVTTTMAPVTTTMPPVTTTQTPITTTQAPVTTTFPPVTTTQAPVTTTFPPVTTTFPPVTTTQAPVTTTQAPVTTTLPPVTTTIAPLIPVTRIVTTTPAPTTTAAPPMDDKTRWLNIHNQLRTKHCSPPLVWNDKLAQLAVDWANKLALSPSPSIAHPTSDSDRDTYLTLRDNSGNPVPNGGYPDGIVGQNLGYRSGNIANIESVVTDWYNEFKPANILQSGGHFTQVVWKDTSEVGCTTVRRPDGYVIYACNYNPPGNDYTDYPAQYNANVLDPKTCKPL